MKKTLQIGMSMVFLLVAGCLMLAMGQDRLKSMPGYDNYQKMSPLIRGAVRQGSLNVNWAEDGKTFDYQWNGKKFTYNVRKLKATETGVTPAEGPGRFGPPGGRMGRPPMGGERRDRGRQFTRALSPDSTLKAFYKDRNLYISKPDGSDVIAVTTDGNEKDRIKYATASWVYGEELYQITAMWWSPDSKKLAFYRFDESQVKDYYLQYNQLLLQDSVEIEPYTKVGSPNPVVDILIYDLVSKKITKIDVRDGKPFDNQVIGHYIYDISWRADGTELLFHRTNRKQNIMELMAADPATGKCRLIIHEEWLPSYTENSPTMVYLKDNNRFIWVSERTGFKNFYLYDLSGKLLATLTSHPFEVSNIVKVDEEAGFLWYMARSGNNHMLMQLHRVGLDGQGDIRLTDPAFNHRVSLAPNGKYFVDIAQTHDQPPFTQLLDAKGKVLARLAESDLTKFNELGLKKVEMFTYKSADGVTELHGMLHYPSTFDPQKKYPVLISIYGGPETNSASENFSTTNTLTEYGFIVASFDARNAAGRGKKFMDPFYGHMCVVEMDDFAAGMKSLWNRPYIDKDRVGIFGTSYGGTTSAACILRHPDVFTAASAMSAVTDQRNYDNIYTERYMGLVEENLAGYEATRLGNYAKNLKGRLMIYYGTSDNNVHPANSLQLIHDLQRAGKSFEVQVGPDQGHTALNYDRMMEFFIENLIMK